MAHVNGIQQLQAGEWKVVGFMLIHSFLKNKLKYVSCQGVWVVSSLHRRVSTWKLEIGSPSRDHPSRVHWTSWVSAPTNRHNPKPQKGTPGAPQNSCDGIKSVPGSWTWQGCSHVVRLLNLVLMRRYMWPNWAKEKKNGNLEVIAGSLSADYCI